MTKTNTIRVSPQGHLTWQGKAYKCALGKSGVTQTKQEGDGGTPIGLFPIREVFYRPDRLTRPQTNLALYQLTPADGWCDDVDHLDYNKKVELPHTGRVEELWRKETIYDLIVVLGYNDAPPVKGKGSAIFMHIAKISSSGDYNPTEGCIALKRDDLLEIIETLDVNSQIEISKR